jgi:hypothetical protein
LVQSIHTGRHDVDVGILGLILQEGFFPAYKIKPHDLSRMPPLIARVLDEFELFQEVRAYSQA